VSKQKDEFFFIIFGFPVIFITSNPDHEVHRKSIRRRIDGLFLPPLPVFMTLRPLWAPQGPQIMDLGSRSHMSFEMNRSAMSGDPSMRRVCSMGRDRTVRLVRKFYVKRCKQIEQYCTDVFIGSRTEQSRQNILHMRSV
jgi:hypothetical protein